MLWYKGVDEGAKRFMSSWHARERQAADTRKTERESQTDATKQTTAHTDQRPGTRETTSGGRGSHNGITTAVEESRREVAERV